MFRDVPGISRHLARHLVAATTLSAAVLATGCDSEPNVQLKAEGGADFGPVALSLSKTKTITATNTGDAAVKLGSVSASSLGIDAPYTLTGGTCSSGMMLEAKGSCTIEITFSPVDPGTFVTSVELDYIDDEQNVSTSLDLTGWGVVDCSISPELQAARQEGVNDALQQMDLDRIAGAKAGAALTQADGYADGYPIGFNEGYNIGYNDPVLGYPAGYSAGYANGYNDGYLSSSACNAGASQGDSQGYADGFDDGAYYGYNDGYEDGESVGWSTGYDSGYSAGANSCNQEEFLAQGQSGKKREKLGQAKQAITNLGDACYQQGYGATYSTSAYNQAFEQAKANNPQYQSGLSSGKLAGRSAGIVAGRTEGHALGYIDGDTAGYNDGTDDAFAECYAAAYVSAYDFGYDVGYNDPYQGYGAGYDAGYDYGWDAGYDAGYIDGEYDWCTGFAQAKRASSKYPTLRIRALNTAYGAKQKWWIKTADGRFGDRKVKGKGALLPALTQEQRAAIQAKVKTKAQGRKDLRVQAMTRKLLENVEQKHKPAKRRTR